MLFFSFLNVSLVAEVNYDVTVLLFIKFLVFVTKPAPQTNLMELSGMKFNI